MNVIVERDKHKKMTLTEQIDSIKNTLYRKIDVCFMKYGLRGLKKIDESIADGLKCFIAEEEGVPTNSLGESRNNQNSEPLWQKRFDDPMMLAGQMDNSWENEVIVNESPMVSEQKTNNSPEEFNDPIFDIAGGVETNTDNVLTENNETNGEN